MFRMMMMFGVGLTLTLASAPAFAQVKEARHNMASGSDVWRVELRNFNQFVPAGRPGDSGIQTRDEIHTMEVKLESEFAPFGVSANYQFHSVREHARNMMSGLGAGNRTFVQRRQWEEIAWMLQPREGYNLWIHTKQYFEETGGSPLIFFAITVSVRELDCVRKRICDRGDNGQITYLFKLPVPKRRSSTCIAQNTFKLTGESQFIEGQRSAKVTLTSMADAKDVRSIPFSMKRSNPEMFIKNAEICIASTSK